MIASHNLRELEDICDHVGLLHRGDMLLSREVEELKSNLHRVQCAVDETQKERLLAALQVVKMEQRGSLLTLTVRGEEQAVMKMHPSGTAGVCRADSSDAGGNFCE